MSYIKREDALDAVLFALAGTGQQSKAIYAVKDAPTADVVEVRHGSWIVRGLCNPKCSICGKYGYYKDAFCPNCGAKMDGERSENGT